ncbi:hypothetical protein BU202_06640 [Streptococcus cuniculi]|uniref:DUF624 domain-containing protein n=1 Tax=Streptococcus cuniculi TaxID=1432788 RepID=A0A1Q8E7E7_9STRE|nr:DUF624 domain-containing protein [Streptococcus cuniculi]OLF47703.1 hypothetical protein BU202_06640 [Streptococcus cuniculi]
MGKVIEFVFQKVYLALLVSGIFFLLTVCGGLVGGFAPAGATVMSLVAAHGYDYRSYTWSEAWTLFRSNLKRSNLVFYSLFLLEMGLVYGLYLVVQLPPSILMVMVIFVQVLLALFVLLAYPIYLKLQVYFEMSYLISLKLSFIGLFISIMALIKLLIGTALLVWLGYHFPAVGFFLLVGAWHFYASDILEPIYQGLQDKIR